MRTRTVILAAGKGTRMNNGGTPKVLTLFEGKPLIQYLLDAVAASGIDPRPVIVTGYQADLVEKTLGDGYDYVRQEEQLGTGHAVRCTEELLIGKNDAIIMLNGDHPFIQASTIRSLQELHERDQCPLSMMTVQLEDFSEWRESFADFGRVIRDAKGRITKIVEAKDASDEERAIREVNPSLFCFNAAWLWEHLRKITNRNAKNEYYITDLVQIAIDEGACIASMQINPVEGMGINTPTHLEIMKNLMRYSR